MVQMLGTPECGSAVRLMFGNARMRLCRWNRGPLWPRCEEHQHSGPPKEVWVCWGLKVEGTPGYGFVDGGGAALWSKNVGNVKVGVRGYKRGPLWSRCWERQNVGLVSA